MKSVKDKQTQQEILFGEQCLYQCFKQMKRFFKWFNYGLDTETIMNNFIEKQ